MMLYANTRYKLIIRIHGGSSFIFRGNLLEKSLKLSSRHTSLGQAVHIEAFFSPWLRTHIIRYS